VLRDWAIDEFVFRRALAEIDITELRRVRGLGSFTAQDKALMHRTIDTILADWPRLLAAYPLAEMSAFAPDGPE
jgi:hypothetical protein